MNESKWCKCDEPKLKCNSVMMLLSKDSNFVADRLCQGCEKPWRKWKGIRGTELIDYPIGTEFYAPYHARVFSDIREKIRLIRNEKGALTLQVYRSKNNWMAWHDIECAYWASYMLQDRFEIAEDGE